MPARSEHRLRGDEGGAFVAALLVAAALLALITSALADLGSAVVDRTRARTAADAAALAGLRAGAPEAARIAARNGAVLVSFTEDPAASQVAVIVAVDGVTATARATDAP